MTQQINITVGSGDTEEQVILAGIPSDIWDRFKAKAALQFPSQGELGWAAYLSEVIVAAGGEGDVRSYFMTKVPGEYADAVAAHLAQVSLTWEQFHAYMLRSAIVPGQLRMTNFRGSEKMGMLICLGLDPNVFGKVQEQTGQTFEVVMATILASAQAGQLQMGPGTVYLEPVKSDG